MYIIIFAIVVVAVAFMAYRYKTAKNEIPAVSAPVVENVPEGIPLRKTFELENGQSALIATGAQITLLSIGQSEVSIKVVDEKNTSNFTLSLSRMGNFGNYSVQYLGSKGGRAEFMVFPTIDIYK